MFKQFKVRLAVIFGILIAIALSGAVLAVLLTTSNQVERTLQRELTVSERLFRELMDSRAEQLRRAAEVLTDDFGFKRAVATEDRDTIVSALVNHGDRIGTDLIALQNPDGQEIASTHNLDLKQLISGEQGGKALLVSEGQLYQVVTVPVTAPNLIAWATLGFEVNNTLTEQLKELANADITLWLEQPSLLLASSLPASLREGFAQALSSEQQGYDGWLQQSGLALQETTLTTVGGDVVHVSLTTSRAEAMRQFDELLVQILLIGAIALVITLIVALFVAKTISTPVALLSQAASKLKSGDYSPTNLQSRKDEFGQLADTFESMRSAIALRERKVRFQATHDQLTELPNRRELQRLLNEKLGDSASSGWLLLINIRNFRRLNDSVGQRMGDDVLKQLAGRLLSGCQSNDILARFGGDEFALVTEAETESRIARRLEDLSVRLNVPFVVGGSQFELKFNCGAVQFPQQASELDSLIRRAQVSVKHAKEHNQFNAFYQEGFDEAHLRRLAIVEQLPKAIARGGFTLVAQPKVRATDGRTVAAEMLIRWHDEQLGWVGPDEFIPLAEQSGMITEITHWVVEQAEQWVNQLRTFKDDIKLSINISAVDLINDKLANDLVALSQRNMQRYLILEVTESALMNEPEKSIACLKMLSELGYEISIDDYGTGYSSLSQIRRLPINELKIDRAFIQYLMTQPDDQSIVRSTIQLAHELNLRVVAEGVEDEASWHWLLANHCDVLQGYYFSKPISFEELHLRLLKEKEHA
ncbi:MAG: signal protein [Idiomarina sp. T82-3]|uniref:bifunctional diguanylate cyclase/phosphodiesterase n=1 Tax=Idiomarina TaxID=135575 RepID=UPI0007980ECD|nr:EAL domain-containing protein [Idiomarina sp. T82-3]KXS36013.1 MAG: signal protein [Idiomarina sp. T82-3]